MAFRVDNLLGVLDRIGNANAKREFYLTDAVEIARADGARAAVVACAEDEVLGVNSREQLARAEAIFQTARAPRRDARGRDADCPRDRVAVVGHADRARRHHRAQRLLRAGRQRGGRGRDQGELLHRTLAHRTALARWSVCAAAPGSRSRRARARRQFRRAQEREARSGRQGQSPVLPRRRRGGAPIPTSAPAPSSATTTASTNPAPRSAPASSSARTPRSSRR